VTAVPAAVRHRALVALCAVDLGGSIEDLDAEVRALLTGVAEHAEAIDQAIAAKAEHWRLSRMPVVDRNLLRLGAYEILFTQAKARTVASAAGELANLLSTEDSARFVRALLAHLG
jgi:transcription antitermination protein NusB